MSEPLFSSPPPNEFQHSYRRVVLPEKYYTTEGMCQRTIDRALARKKVTRPQLEEVVDRTLRSVFARERAAAQNATATLLESLAAAAAAEPVVAAEEATLPPRFPELVALLKNITTSATTTHRTTVTAPPTEPAPPLLDLEVVVPPFSPQPPAVYLTLPPPLNHDWHVENREPPPPTFIVVKRETSQAVQSAVAEDGPGGYARGLRLMMQGPRANASRGPNRLPPSPRWGENLAHVAPRD